MESVRAGLGKAEAMGAGTAGKIDSKERRSWEPITPEKVNKVDVRRPLEDNLSERSSSGCDAVRIADLNEDLGEKERSANAAGLTFIDVNRDARNFACFDTHCCADLFKHFDRGDVSEVARDTNALSADRAVGSSDDSGCLESNLAAATPGQRSVELLDPAHRESTPVFDTNIQLSNVDHQGFDKSTDPFHTSTPSKIGTNMKTRQKPKKKKHIPKVLREGKPRRMLKRKDINSPTPPVKKKKHGREKIGNDLCPSQGDMSPDPISIMEKCHSSFGSPQGDLNISFEKCSEVFQAEVKSCRRHLDFGANHTEDGKVVDRHYGNDLLQSKWDDQKSSSLLSSRVKRIYRNSLCLNKIRRIGPNFPIEFKKKRIGRRKRTAAMKMTYMLFVLCPRDFVVSFPRDLKKKRIMRRNANCFGSLAEGPDEMQNLQIPINRDTFVDDNVVQFEAGHVANIDQHPEKPKRRAKRQGKSRGPKQKLQQELERNVQQEIERIIQRIIDLNIDDLENHARQDQNTPQPQLGILVPYKGKKKKKQLSTEGILVPYKAKTKKKAPRVEFDVETLRRWKEQLLLDDGGARDEADKDRDRKWEWEREVFRGRVESFLARMHHILGDRHFTFWKGSVVDSIIGVFLTQNVSDNLSSNACMSLASKFPLYPINSEQTEDEEMAGVQDEEIADVQETVGNESSIEKKKKAKVKEKKTDPLVWEELRKSYSRAEPRSEDHTDSVDWDAVRRAKLGKIAHTIKERGQHNKLAERIKEFLNELVRRQGSIDLEWLRNCPPDKAKEYLLEVHGLGLKSVECVRLLTLHHVAFPVDTNVGRIAVRLGWVPLEPLPENLQIHMLESFPVLDEIQKYLMPRLREFDHRTLYELHYHLITFGKVFCIKTKPNCNACPMRGECKHYASAYASGRFSLPAPEDRVINGSNSIICNGDSSSAHSSIPLGALPLPETKYQTGSQEPIIEEPVSPKIASKELLERDIEDFYYNDGDEIPTINLSSANFSTNLQSCINDVRMFEEKSRALVALNNFIPMPKLKEVTRLRTEHYVYMLPDSHPLIRVLPKREGDDPCPYLLVMRTAEEAADSSMLPNGACDSHLTTQTCNEESSQEDSYATIKGTLLIPCRTFLRARFPLNGTYFQVNEVFADHESSHNPIDVPRRWIWNLPRRLVYFGTSASSIFKGLTMEKIQSCFRNGFICVRGIDRKTGYPRPLISRFHQQPHKLHKLKEAT